MRIGANPVILLATPVLLTFNSSTGFLGGHLTLIIIAAAAADAFEIVVALPAVLMRIGAKPVILLATRCRSTALLTFNSSSTGFIGGHLTLIIIAAAAFAIAHGGGSRWLHRATGPSTRIQQLYRI
tara:strand:+ start:82 stop:459 length:378 start_codon:yes stop_codon:yes gene_type:complete